MSWWREAAARVFLAEEVKIGGGWANRKVSLCTVFDLRCEPPRNQKGSYLMEQESNLTLDGILRTSQIILGALAAGIVFFLVIVTVVMGAGVQPLDGQAVISFVMAGLALSLLAVRAVVPALVVSSGRQRIAAGTWNDSQPNPQMKVAATDDGRLLQLFVTQTILGAAILEGGAFANLVAFMLEGQIYSVVIAVLFTLGILAAFPTRNGLVEWLENQTRRLKETRHL